MDCILAFYLGIGLGTAIADAVRERELDYALFAYLVFMWPVGVLNAFLNRHVMRAQAGK